MTDCLQGIALSCCPNGFMHSPNASSPSVLFSRILIAQSSELKTFDFRPMAHKRLNSSLPRRGRKAVTTTALHTKIAIRASMRTAGHSPMGVSRHYLCSGSPFFATHHDFSLWILRWSGVSRCAVSSCTSSLCRAGHKYRVHFERRAHSPSLTTRSLSCHPSHASTTEKRAD